MPNSTLNDRIDQASGTAKKWAGRATRDPALERSGRIQSGMAGTRIKVRGVVKKIMTRIQERRANRRR